MPPTPTNEKVRTALNPTKVLTGAVSLADAIGIEPFTIRKLAAELDVKPMTIYHHVPNKGAILDGMVDIVFGEIELPPTDTDWKMAMRLRAMSARAVLARHPWATPLMESRTSPGPMTLRHHDAVIGCFRRGGLSIAMTGRAYALVDAYIYGFALQEANLPATGGEGMADLAESILAPLAEGEYPHLVEFTAEQIAGGEFEFGDSFEFGLDLILEGLATAAEARTPKS